MYIVNKCSLLKGTNLNMPLCYLHFGTASCGGGDGGKKAWVGIQVVVCVYARACVCVCVCVCVLRDVQPRSAQSGASSLPSMR